MYYTGNHSPRTTSSLLGRGQQPSNTSDEQLTVKNDDCNYSESDPENEGSDQGYCDVQRRGSASGGLFFLRKRTHIEQRLISQHRAAEMIAKFELSDNKDLSLNRNANFGPKPMPTLGACLGAQQVAFASLIDKKYECPGRENRSSNGKTKPSVQKSSRLPLKRLPLKPKGNIFTFDEAKMAKKSRSQQRLQKVRASRVKFGSERVTKMLSQVSVVGPSDFSVATTMAETPSPRSIAPAPSEIKTTQVIHRLC